MYPSTRTVHAKHHLPSLHLTSWNTAWKLLQKKYRTEQDSHRDTGSYSSCATALWRSYLEKEGGLFRPQFCIHKIACRQQEKLVSNPSRPSPEDRLTPCPYSCAASPVFLAVGKQIIQVQTAPKTWLLTINFLIQILFHLPDV